MKKLLIVLLAIFPITAFTAGYSAGQGKVIYIQPDAQIAQTKQEKNIGQVAGIAVIKPTPTPVFASETTLQAGENSQITIQERGLWGVVNQYRSEHGLSPFAKDSTLCGFSGTRLGQVQGAGSLNHDGFQVLLEAYLKQGYTKISENLAQGFGNSNEIISGWDGSTGHRALLQATDLDRGCSSEGGGYVVLIAGKK